MCGRFHNQVKAMHEWVDVLGDWPAEAALSYNVSPTQIVPIVVEGATVAARWGLVPGWAKEFASKYPTHNARLETAREKPSFRSAWKHSRTCLVPTAGFYEWRREGSIKQPYFINKCDDMLVLAGLWEAWNDRVSFTILTVEASGVVAELHHRMPVMLDPQAASTWLDSGTAYADVFQDQEVCQSVVYSPLSTLVNNARNDGPQLLQPEPAD